MTQVGINLGPRHAHVLGWAKSYTKSLHENIHFIHDQDAVAASPYSQILLCFKQNRHGFHTIRKEKPTAAARINISFPIVAAALVCI